MTQKTTSIYEHCVRALDLAVKRTGANGLPLILGGDWNDGMNRVGEEGKGESVWLGWFLLKMLGNFIRMCQGAWRRQARQGLGQACPPAEAGAGERGLGRRMVPARQL